METKICKHCKKVLNVRNFYKNSTLKDGLDSRCKKCLSKYWRKKRYNLSPKEILKLKKLQNHLCAICNDKLKRKYCIDHNHENNHVRGILCFKCNSALGKFNDDPTLLFKAANYIHINQIKFIKNL